MSILLDSYILHTVLMDKVRVVSVCRLGCGQGPCVPLAFTTLTASPAAGSLDGWVGGSTVSQKQEEV